MRVVVPIVHMAIVTMQ